MRSIAATEELLRLRRRKPRLPLSAEEPRAIAMTSWLAARAIAAGVLALALAAAVAGAPASGGAPPAAHRALARVLRRGGGAAAPGDIAGALARAGPAAVGWVESASGASLLHHALAGLHAVAEARAISVGGGGGSSSSGDGGGDDDGDDGVALIRALVAAGAPPDAGCPLSHALSYRQLPAAAALVAAMSPTGVAGCVREVDAHGDTLLHAVASSRAAGFARHVAAAAASAPAGTTAAAAGRALRGVAGALGLTCVPAAPTRAAVSACLGAGDVALVLAAASGAGVPVDEALLEATDGAGLTPLLRTCQQVRCPRVPCCVIC